MPAARREVVGADDGGATGDPPPTSDVVRRREVGDATFVVVGGEPGDAADFAEGSRVEQQIDALAAAELAAAALPHHAGVLGVGCEAGVRHALQGGDLVESRGPG